MVTRKKGKVLQVQQEMIAPERPSHAQHCKLTGGLKKETKKGTVGITEVNLALTNLDFIGANVTSGAAAKDSSTLTVGDATQIDNTMLAVDDAAAEGTITLAVDDAAAKDSILAVDDVDLFYRIDVEVNVSGSKEVLDITSEAEGSVDDENINIQKLDKPILIFPFIAGKSFDLLASSLKHCHYGARELMSNEELLDVQRQNCDIIKAGSVHITEEHYNRLNVGELLNNSIIALWSKWIFPNTLPFHSSTYIFSSFLILRLWLVGQQRKE